MPASPSEAPVTEVHLNATAYSSCANASVSIENETPVASVHTQPTPIATMPLNNAASSTANTSGMSVCSSRLPAA